ncbi:MAG: hypothetical protein OHK0013_02080 [Sandaracinaceae bacterium]
MRGPGRICAWALCGAAAALAAKPARVQADDARSAQQEPFAPPPPPEKTPDWWELEVGGSAIAPLERSAVCPGVTELGRVPSCVLNAGVGVGARVLYRTPEGLGWIVGYDLWVLDSANVYEVALAHAVRAGVRWVLDGTTRVQPWIGATIGVLLFGEPASIATGGGLVTAGAGLHAELSDDFAVLASAEARVMGLAPFQTADGARRADPFGVSVVLDVTVGAVVRFGALVER